jgi:hypothetical protein
MKLLEDQFEEAKVQLKNTGVSNEKKVAWIGYSRNSKLARKNLTT